MAPLSLSPSSLGVPASGLPGKHSHFRGFWKAWQRRTHRDWRDITVGLSQLDSDLWPGPTLGTHTASSFSVWWVGAVSPSTSQPLHRGTRGDNPSLTWEPRVTA